MENNYNYTAVVESMSEIQHFERTTKPDIFKRLIKLVFDDNNSIYAEIRDSNISKIAKEGIEIGSQVQVRLEFQSIEKGCKHYNNIVIKDIKLQNEEITLYKNSEK